MLDVIVSRDPEDARALAFQNIAKERRDRRVYFVVPSQYTLESERALFDALDVDSLIDVKVKSFRTIEREVIDQTSGKKKKHLSEAGRQMLLRTILLELEDDLTFYAVRTLEDGFLDVLSTTLREYKEYGITPETLEFMSEESEHTTNGKEKLHDLATIYRRYLERIEDVFLDVDDGIRLATSQVAEVDFYRTIHFYFDGFHSLSRLELDFVGELLRIGADVTVTLTSDISLLKAVQQADGDPEFVPESVIPDAQAFSITTHFFQQLSDLGHGPIELIAAPQSTRVPEEIRHAQRALFSYETKVRDPRGHIEVYRYRNTEQEVDGLVIQIEKLLQAGVRYRDIQVIMTDPSAHGKWIQRKFDREGYAYFFDEKRDILTHPLVRFIRFSLMLATKDFRREHVINLLKTGFLPVDQAEVERFQTFAEKRDLRGQMFFDDKYFVLDEAYFAENPRKRAQAEIEYAAVGRVRDVLLQYTAVFESLIGDVEKTMRDFTTDLYRYLEQEEVQNSLNAYESLLASRLDKELLDEQHQIWDSIVDIMDQIVEIAGDNVGDISLFTSLVDVGIRAIQVGIVPPFVDQISVGSLMRSRQSSRKYSFVVGMNDSYLPKPRKGHALMTETELTLLRDRGFYLPSMHRFGVEEENLAVYSLFSKATSRISLSYALIDSGNQQMQPSWFVRRILEATGGNAHVSKLDIPLEEQLYSKSLLAADIPENLRNKLEGREERKFSGEILRYLLQSKRPENQTIGQSIQFGLQYDNARSPLPMDVVAGLYADRGVYSATQIESYTACPYRHFVRYGLRPEEVREVAIDPIDVGNVIHGAVQAWTDWIAEDPDAAREMPDDVVSERAEEFYHAEIGKHVDAVRREEPKNRFILGLLRKTMHEASQKLLEQLRFSTARIMYHEVNFGRNKQFQPIELEIDGTNVRIEGRIDRVDILDVDGTKYTQVVDYKTGSKSFEIGKVEAGIDLQLALYLLATTDGKDGTYEPFGAFYLLVRPQPLYQTTDEIEDIDQNETKRFQMQGFLLKEEPVLRAADQSFSFDKDDDVRMLSEVFALRGRKRNSMDKDNLVTKDELNKIITRGKEIAKESLTEIRHGEISPRPYRIPAKNITACKYCDYKTICKFESSREFSRQRFVKNSDWKEWREDGDL